MDRVLYNFLVEVPRAATIWVVLMGLAVGAAIVLLVRPARDRPGYDVAVREAERRDALLAARAEELNRYAEEVAVAAERSTVTARRHRDEWLAAQEAAEAAWQAYEDADTAARRVDAAAVLPAPRTPQTPAEYADRERYLHRAAMAACWRRELSVLQLSDVLAHRNGWDPRRHPVEQEVVLRRAARDSLLSAYRAAAERERAAWRDGDLAATAARSLRTEAFTAAARAAQARRWLPADGPAEASTGDLSGTARESRGAVRWRTARAG
ncbi:hypothetical protein [Plantactinospora sp. CA-290183]|uniref:hypothetical protein n=1 Tax=Plantactinospora sp. CA-290183 TaxID=3240006 RepID=UPI003D9441DA